MTRHDRIRQSTLVVVTPDGSLDTYTFRPDAEGRWPVVLFYMDAFGVRSDLAEMARRLASHGYFVVVPNLYYRLGAYAPIDPHQVAGDGPERARFKGMIASLTPTMVMRDTHAVLTEVGSMPEADGTRIGAVGYCMGGGFALSAAGTFPDRVVAAAAIHGGALATDRPDSPHLLAAAIRAQVYVGVAEVDPTFSDVQRARLEQALTDGGVDYELVVYPGAGHGFAVSGHLAYHRESAERQWQALLTLFARTLPTAPVGT